MDTSLPERAVRRREKRGEPDEQKSRAG